MMRLNPRTKETPGPSRAPQGSSHRFPFGKAWPWLSLHGRQAPSQVMGPSPHRCDEQPGRHVQANPTMVSGSHE
jgi:hypothetical protein